MAFCKNCGNEIKEGETACSKCGTEVASKVPTGKDITSQFEAADIEKNKTMGGLAYLIFFLPLIVCPDSKFGKFNANQAFVLFLGMVASALINIIPILGWIISIIAYIVIAVFSIMGLINGFQGKAKELPLIGKIKIIKY